MQIANCKLSPLAPLPSPLSPRSGITLLEVLVSIFILAVGLLGVAAMIPIGKLSLVETNVSDRTGACGRAAMREVEVRRMLDYRYWYPNSGDNAFVIDPIGFLSMASPFLGPLPRVNMRVLPDMTALPLNPFQADAIFRWSDDLVYVQAKDSTNPTNGDRPMPVPNLANQQSEGNFSWFLTVSPSPSDLALLVPVGLRRNYTVSVVVCYKRNFTAAGEHPVTVSNFPGGGSIQLGEDVSNIVKNDQWVMLVGSNAVPVPVVAKWYRVVGVGGNYLSLVGPDWDDTNFPAAATTLVVVEGVTGVYTTTVQLDDDCIWTR